MTPEDKYFYLYLLTNPNTTQIGVYQITKKKMAFDLGYSTESISSLLERFINMHKLVKYNEKTRELAVIHWGKYNLNKAGKPVIDCVKKELSEVKDKTLLLEIMNHIPNESISNEFSRYVHDTCDDTSTIGGQKEKEKEKEKENNNADAVVFYQENFGVISPFLVESIGSWEQDLSSETVIEAMKRALAQNKRTWSYIEAILKNWISLNLKTINDVLSHEQNRKGGGQAGKDETSSFGGVELPF
ncbi:DnaD domain-containing protein [Peribacillus frigoritolerans]|uniref:DnaD domain-containing protein n=1 Tax=Peribacillus frigoritolerans TaxID=450367 RepID=UPI003F50B150